MKHFCKVCGFFCDFLVAYNNFSVALLGRLITRGHVNNIIVFTKV